ncbi:hypothetical protein BGZ51_006459 [Haplosporangium sp. Z 767]|nr:hypothetical protein BGZ51_006459 [Haplosporangium sp. Z 767]KAF9190875.1 hypothetical protein BGZ50_009753 [Haplosporangium sp. Z 11]
MIHYHDEHAVNSHVEDQQLLDNIDDDDEYHDYNPTESHGSTVEPTMPSTTATTDEQAESAWFAELQKRPWYRRPSIFWLMPLLFSIGVIMGIIGSPLEQLDIQIICKDYLEQHDSPTIGINPLLVEDARRVLADDRCKSSEVLAFAALIQSRVHALKGVLCLLTLAKWTSLSDIYGRKFLIQLALIALALAQMITWFAASPHNPFGYRLLYVNNALLGLIPGGNLINPALFAYIADCTTASTRSVMVGYTVISFFLGGIIGPYLGGYIVKVTGDLTSVIRVSVICLMILFLYLIFVPESLRAQYISVADGEGDDDISQPVVSIAPGCTVEQPFVVRVRNSVKRGLYLYKRMVVKVGKNQYQACSQNQEETGTLLQDFQDDEQPTKPVGKVALAPALNTIESIKMDISFAYCSLALNTISYLIVPLFMSVPVLYVGK